MNPTDVLLVATLALVLIGLVYALISWRAGYGAGRVLEGVGLIALSAGLFLSGLMKLAYDLITALIGWGTSLVWTALVATGVGALALAVVLWLVAGSLNRRGVGVRTKEDIRARREERKAARAAKTAKAGQSPAPARPAAGTGAGAGGTQPTVTRSTAATTGTRPAAAAKGSGAAGNGDEFAEIEDILRKRGIN